ncbi:MAG TPA: ATP-binding protein, partial [Telluria sp.]
QVDICENFLALLGHVTDATTIPFARWLDFLHPQHRGAVEQQFERARAAGPASALHLDMLMRQKDGTYRWFAAHADWYRERPDAPYVLEGVNIDIQELKIVDEERRQAIRQLQAEDVRKNEFLAMLAHELRNPLAPISAGAELLRTARGDDERIRQTSEIISRQVSHMTNLINDLLDVSRVTRGLAELDMQTLDIRHVVADAVEQANPLIHLKRHRLALHMPPHDAMVAGDQKRLVQVIANLLGNAAKYTPPGGDIALSIDVRAAQIVLEIADNGIGMAPDLVQRVFDLFTQAERSSDRSSGGLGVGLALVKSLVELHGGQVAAASEGIGKGSTFTVALPRMHDAGMGSGRPDAGTSAREQPARLKILVVDDNVDAAEVLGMLLDASGHDVIVENAARQALECASLSCPDVALLDIGLPEMDGLALARQLRAMPGLAGLTLIAVTGYGQEADRQNAFAAGFDHYLTKPVDFAQLTALLDEIGARTAL